MLYYIFFKDTKNGQELYQLMKENGIKCTIAPTPKTEDHCCGISILYYNIEDRELIEKLILENKIEILKFYEKEKDINPDRMRTLAVTYARVFIVDRGLDFLHKKTSTFVEVCFYLCTLNLKVSSSLSKVNS